MSCLFLNCVRLYRVTVHTASRTEQDRDNQSCIHLALVVLLCVKIISKKMSAYKVLLGLAVFVVVVKAQRPFYAGLSPIGYPAVQQDFLANRFGEDEQYPIEARGDRNLINRLDALPADNQPFWYLNWKQYETFRRNPQNYPQRPNSFVGTR
ncbi:hypothetical protein PYW07_005075 [Mythimna separata]|uniref:Seminal fluid protein HACP044 n=1 Tax=Mythimna separata TaxID=271217 RepID=A0AAD7YF27_MYTSE|nr:hypothetical protein PYW07_005075 [Mythimna separata]